MLNYMVGWDKKAQHSCKRKIDGLFGLLPVICVLMIGTAFAKDGDVGIKGKVYSFGGNNPYKISDSDDYRWSDDEKTYGSFSINGIIQDTSIDSHELDGVPSFGIDGSDLVFSYNYDDNLLKAKKGEWQLYEDDCEAVDGIDLDEDIDHGSIIIQTSRDRKKWITNKFFTNMFEDTPVQTDPFYTTSRVMLDNGSYFRIIVAYETRKFIETKPGILYIPEDKYEYKRHAEVYEFYAYIINSVGSSENTEKYYFQIGNRTVNTGNNNGYSGYDPIDANDPHYGWEIGDFFVSGYTDRTVDEETGNVVFLKNVGDKVTLWFSLTQDIDHLNGKDNLSICQDDGYDQAFRTKKTDFGKGTIIIGFTDYENKQHDPVLYTDYLHAIASPGADTKVTLFEEGDYEVALDYEIEKRTGNPFAPFEYNDYRASFKFSIRNGNCMVYPFDVSTGSELTNTSITENGFRLDLAKSRYLTLSVKKEVLAPGTNGLVEDKDTRLNQISRDGAEFTDEGIYTISVNNKYTNQSTQKIIYVGTNNVLKAAVVNGLTVEQVNAQIENGMEITDEGDMVAVEIESDADEAVNEVIESEQIEETDEYIEIPIPDFMKTDGDL